MKVLIVLEDSELDSALEVIQAVGGVVSDRELVQLGDDAAFEIGDAKTCVLREVKIPVLATELHQPKPGDPAHGDLGPALPTTKEAAAMLDEQHTEKAPAMSGVKMSQDEKDARLAGVARIAETVHRRVADVEGVFDVEFVLSSLQSIIDVCTWPLDQLPDSLVSRLSAEERAAEKAAT